MKNAVGIKKITPMKNLCPQSNFYLCGNRDEDEDRFEAGTRMVKQSLPRFALLPP